jgi:hypothetical protein
MKKDIFSQIQKRLQKAADVVLAKNGQEADLARQVIFTDGPFLHQGTSEMTEEQSAQLERDNPVLFNYIRSLKKEITDAISS